MGNEKNQNSKTENKEPKKYTIILLTLFKNRDNNIGGYCR